MAKILKGKDVADALAEELSAKTRELNEKGVWPCLAVLRVGAREEDLAYEAGTLKRFEKLGIGVRVTALPEDISQEAFESTFREINRDENIHGILLFRPLPETLSEEPIKRLIHPDKDVDCMCSENIAKTLINDKSGYAPCTPSGVLELLKYYGLELAGKDVTLVGRSLVVGRPLAMLLLAENATVTVCHTKTKDLAEKCRRADIIIAAAGAARMIGKDFVSPGTVVIDVGVNAAGDGSLCGDVDFDSVSTAASAITPVPGGVGSVTTSMLAAHTLKAAEKLLI